MEGGVRLVGDLGLQEANSIYRALVAAAAKDRELRIELEQVEHINPVALAALIAGCRVQVARGAELRSNGRPETRMALEEALGREPALKTPPPLGFFETVGERTIAQASSARGLAAMTVSLFVRFWQVATGKIRMPRRALGDKVVSMGAEATGIVALLSLLLGMILSFEATSQLRQLGAKVLVPDVVGLSLVREFAPLLCAVVVIARNGAAIASELASMQAGQEVDALRTMGVEPVRFLVVPRSLGLLFTTPALTLLAVFVGVVGAAGVAVTVADLELTLFYRRLTGAVDLGDLLFGLSKSFVFALTTGLSAAAIGMAHSGSAADVGRATTRAVVLGIFLLVVFDAIFAFSSGLAGAPTI